MKKFWLIGLHPKDHGSGGGAWKGTTRLFVELDKYHSKDNKIQLFVSVKNLKNYFIKSIYPLRISNFFYYLMALFSKVINHILLINNDRHFSFNFLPSLLDVGAYFHGNKGRNLYLHWVGNNFVSIWLILFLTKNKRVIIKFADYWWLTGGCHYPENCIQLSKNNCVDCPMVRKRFRWIPKYLFSLKRNILNRKNIKIVSPSEHLYKSTLNCLNNKNVFHIPNGISIFPYKERDHQKNSIGIVAHGLKDPRKNFIQIKEIINFLVEDKNLIINICGDSSKKVLLSINKNINCSINDFGFIKEDQKMREFYYESNYILFLSKQDNSPNQIKEGMANGSIMITFDNTFSKEHIINKKNGYLLSTKLSNKDIAKDIIQIVNYQNSQEISKASYNYATKKFSISRMALQYKKLLD